MKQTGFLLGQPNLHRAGSRGGVDKHKKRKPKKKKKKRKSREIDTSPLGSACPNALRVYYPLFAKENSEL